MQQTKHYKLNKPEMDDTFAVAPLNENADLVDAQLAALHAADGALDGRIAVLELHRFITGVYTGDDEDTQFIDLGFTPAAVIVHSSNVSTGIVTLVQTGFPTINGGSGSGASETALEITDNGFLAHQRTGSRMNRKGSHYRYLAFA